MTAQAYPGIFPGALTTGYLNAGAVQKQRTALAYPGIFPGALTTGYLGVGAVQRGETQAITGSGYADADAFGAGTVTQTSPATGGAQGGGLLREELEPPRYIQPRRPLGIIEFYGKTGGYVIGTPIITSNMTGIGRSALRASCAPIRTTRMRSLGFTASVGSGSLRIAARNDLHVRSVTMPIGIG